jgi:uncharacterized lipoprotein NlpE involved in copper resistance
MKKILLLSMTLILSLVACQNKETVDPTPTIDPTPIQITTTADEKGGYYGSSSSTTPGAVVVVGTVPQAAKEYIAKNYAGYAISEAQLENSYWATFYKITIGHSKDKKKLKFDLTWKFLGEI